MVFVDVITFLFILLTFPLIPPSNNVYKKDSLRSKVQRYPQKKKPHQLGLFYQVQISDLKHLRYQYLFVNVHTAHQMLYVLLELVLNYQSQRTTSSRRTPMA